MPTAVRKALVDVVVQHGGRSTEEAKAYVEALEASRRLQEETWS
jgi:sulfite reductase alpha subunit-like flavoprotein